MKPTCDLCPREATRWYEPAGAARCGLHECNDNASVPLTRRPPPPDFTGLAGLGAAQAPTVRPPADGRCPRCSRILIAAPCPCVTPVERYLRAADERDAAWRALSRAERIEAIRRRAA